MQREKDKHCGVCKIPYFERNNYFHGKLMTAQDFTDEQCYFNEKRWLINRMINGWGVVCGLDVHLKESEADKIIVTPGLAIDCCGREILVCEEQEVPLHPEESRCHKEQKRQGQGERSQKQDEESLVICLEYYECKTQPRDLPPSTCHKEDRLEFNRIRESFKIRVVPESEIDLEAPYGKFCPPSENYKGPLHDYVCTKLREGCPACPERPCLFLAGVTITPSEDKQSPPIIKIDQCSKRKLVYSNPILFDLINCFQGDSTHIVDINWLKWLKPENGPMKWEDFVDMMTKQGLQVSFDRDMNEETLNDKTFLFMVKQEELGTSYFLCRYVPSVPIKYAGRTATFKPTEDWITDVLEGTSVIKDRGGVCTVVLRGDHIMDAENKRALDGNFIGGKLPSGNGTPGGDFVSWFIVQPESEERRPPRRRR